jgi:hypothetical protein
MNSDNSYIYPVHTLCNTEASATVSVPDSKQDKRSLLKQF